MIKLGQVRRNGLTYGIRSIGDGIDIITPHDEFLEEGVASLSEVVKLIEADSVDSKYDNIRLLNPANTDMVFWPKED